MGPNSRSLFNLQGPARVEQGIQAVLMMIRHLGNKIPGWGNNVWLFWLFTSLLLADETRYRDFLVFGSMYNWNYTTTNCQTMRPVPHL